jgi:2-phospho-L-lactate/phosphoenolpyruvate guanylyltransferase
MIVAVVPVKRLSEAKSRLSGHLSTTARHSMVLSLLDGVVSALRSSGCIDRIALTTPDVDMAHDLGLECIPDRGNLNASLAGASKWAMCIGAHALLIVPADLPFLEGSCIRSLVQIGAEAPIVIAPTHDGGTGALLLTPPHVLSPSFGPNSFERHLSLARQHGVEVRVMEDIAFRYDLDTPQDLERLRSELVH